jgi:hypothetical protein
MRHRAGLMHHVQEHCIVNRYVKPRKQYQNKFIASVNNEIIDTLKRHGQTSNHDLGQFFLDMAMKYISKLPTQQKMKDFKQNIFNGFYLYSLQRQTKIEILRR